jgi:hypothetical protein
MKARVALLGLLALAAPSVARAAAYGKHEGTASYVYTRELELPAGTHVFQTVLYEGGDTVMHLWEPFADLEWAMNDDYGGQLSSRIEVTLPAAMLMILVVRSYSDATASYCNVLHNGALLDSNVPFGGKHFTVDTAEHDVLQTVLVNGGTDDTVLFGLNAAGSLRDIDDDEGVGFASKLVGAFDKVVVGTYGWTPGATRLIVNR